MYKEAGVLYQIGNRDEITFVDEGWAEFAASNKSVTLTSEKVVGRVLWDFIADDATIQIYGDMVRRARAGHKVEFKFRCDSPYSRRLMKMTIRPLEDEGVEFKTETLSTTERGVQLVLDRDSERSCDFIRKCGWCNKFNVGGEDWRELEEATKKLGFFENGHSYPQLSHGICDECRETLLSKLRSRAPRG
jgi:wyosine [tRNA(Phe)-imidazoG37] synthetase (radical SAM superfamily)